MGRGYLGRTLDSSPVEALFVSLLVLAGLTIAWFSVYVVYKLFKGQA